MALRWVTQNHHHRIRLGHAEFLRLREGALLELTLIVVLVFFVVFVATPTPSPTHVPVGALLLPWLFSVSEFCRSAAAV